MSFKKERNIVGGKKTFKEREGVKGIFSFCFTF